jgi:hypothetical protein
VNNEFVTVENGFVRVKNEFVTVENGFVTVENGFVTVKNGFAGRNVSLYCMEMDLYQVRIAATRHAPRFL